MAATYPPGPAPRTTTSKSLTGASLFPGPVRRNGCGRCRARATVEACASSSPDRPASSGPGCASGSTVLGHDVTRLVRRATGTGRGPLGPVHRSARPRGRRRPRRGGEPRRLPHRRQPALEEVGREPQGQPGHHDPGARRGDRREHAPSRRSWPATGSGSTATTATSGSPRSTHSRRTRLLAGVTRAWQAATQPARHAGARVCILRTSPGLRPAQPAPAARCGCCSRPGSAVRSATAASTCR